MELYKEKGSHKRKKGLLEENNWDKGRYPNTRYSGEKKKGGGRLKRYSSIQKCIFLYVKHTQKCTQQRGGGGERGCFSVSIWTLIIIITNIVIELKQAIPRITNGSSYHGKEQSIQTQKKSKQRKKKKKVF